MAVSNLTVALTFLIAIFVAAYAVSIYFQSFPSSSSQATTGQIISTGTGSGGFPIIYSIIGIIAVVIAVVVAVFILLRGRNPDSKWSKLYKKYGNKIILY